MEAVSNIERIELDRAVLDYIDTRCELGVHRLFEIRNRVGSFLLVARTVF